jgi:uncharacterized protein YdeI (YjbR/CyaY-like superfamily)
MITYPVPADSRFVIVNTTTMQAVPNKTNIRWLHADGLQIPPLPSPYVILEIINHPKPAFDETTSKLERQVAFDIPDEAANVTWDIIPLSVEELDELELQAQIKQAYIDLQASAGSSEERLTRVEKACAFLLRESQGG